MKFTHNKLTKIGAAALAAATALTAVPAFGTMAADKTGSVTVQYKYTTNREEVWVPDAKVELYRVGDVNLSTGEVTFDEEYDDAGINLEASDEAIATTLGSYVVTSSIEPTKSGSTNASGRITFTDLKEGAYIFVGYNKQYDGWTYTLNPSYFTIPSNRDTISAATVTEDAGSELFHDVTIIPKLSRVEDVFEDVTDIEAIKSWDDDNNAYNLRPDGIEVELWQIDPQGVKTKCDTQVLNATNGWRYKWKELDINYQYYCVEKEVPANYVVSEVSGTDSETKTGIHTFTNTYRPPTTTTETTNPPGTYTKREVSKTLPYTGMLWWPVPFLAAGGLALVLIGVAGKRRRAAFDRDSED